MDKDVKFSEDVKEYWYNQLAKIDVDASLQRRVNRCYDQFLSLNSITVPKSLLDIGCGLGLVDVFFARAGTKEIHLMDGDGSIPMDPEYSDECRAWNDVRVAADIVKANSPEDTKVFPHFEDPNLDIKVDMIISFKSWGTHYPVSKYADLAKRCLNPGGFVVLDLRKGERWEPVGDLQLVRHISNRRVVLKVASEELSLKLRRNTPVRR